MKKSLIFAFVAVVAMLVASCKPAVEAPKARFSYDIDGLKVTFTNATKDADSFVWEFGDGKTSTEVSPVHEYEAAGEYTVQLTAKNAGGENKASEVLKLEKKAVEMKIDGDFSDWEQIPSELLAVAKASEKSKYENLYEMRWYGDADNIYFYLEFSAEEYDTTDEGGNPIVGHVVNSVDMMIDFDNDPATGMLNYLWDKTVGTEWLPEIGDIYAENAFEGATLYQFTGATQDDWSWAETTVVGFINGCAPTKLANGHLAIEGAILRAMIPGGVKGCRVGVFTSNTDWAESGVLPETTLEDDGTTVPSPLLEVKLPE